MNDDPIENKKAQISQVESVLSHRELLVRSTKERLKILRSELEHLLK